MNDKIIVVYSSKYGTTKTFAQWIAEELDCECVSIEHSSRLQLQNYGIVIYGGGLYANGISGIKKNRNVHLKKILLFTVGLADPKTTDYTKIINKNSEYIKAESVEIFHLRGGIDYGKLNMLHRVMMSMVKRTHFDKKSNEELIDEDKEFLRTYNGKADYTDKGQIEPIIKYVKNELMGNC